MPADHFSKIIPCFECCSSPCSSADGYRWQQKLIPIIKSVIRAIMKKFHRANLAVREIHNIRTFDYNVQGIYTLGAPSSKGGLQRDRTLEN